MVIDVNDIGLGTWTPKPPDLCQCGCPMSGHSLRRIRGGHVEVGCRTHPDCHGYREAGRKRNPGRFPWLADENRKVAAKRDRRKRKLVGGAIGVLS